MIHPCLNSPLAKKFLLSSVVSVLGNNFKFEYLGEKQNRIRKFLGYESGVHVGLIHEKKPGITNLVLLSL